MSPATVPTSTRGGRSVLRSAAAVEAAALRSLGLVTSLPLTALGNPLTRLLDEALDLSGLDQVLGRSPNPAPVRRSTAGRATSASRSPATSGRAGPGSATAAATTAVGTAARSAATALQRTAGHPTAGSGPGSAAAVAAGALAAGGHSRQATSSTTSRPRANPRPGGAQAPAGDPSDRAGSSPAAVPDLDPGELRAARATSTLRSAARSTSPSTNRSTNRSMAPTASPADGSRSGRTAPGNRGAAHAGPATPAGPATSATSAPQPPRAAYGDAPAANLPVPLTPDFSRGGLAELVARWQDGEPSSPEPDGFPTPTGQFTPAFTAAPERERPLRLGDEERVGLALEQILRREVEQHGLEGGR